MTQQVKVIALEWNVAMLIDVLVELSTRYGWQPVYCVSKNTQDQVKRHFPTAIYHDTHEARYGRAAPELADLPWAGIDQPTAEALGYAEVLALKQMDRLEIMDGFALHDRFIHFHRVASYWSAVLDRLQPDVLLMPTAPHVVYDYVAYVLAKRRGIRAVMFEYVTTEGLLTAIDGFEDGLPPLTAAYKRLLVNPPPGPFVLSDRLEAYWRRLQGSYDQAIPAPTRELLVRAEAIRVAQVEARKAEAKAEAEAGAEAKRLAALAAKQIGDAEAKRLAEVAKRVSPILRALGLQRIAPPPTPGMQPAAPEPAPTLPLPRPPGTDGHYDGRFYAEAEVPEDLARNAAEHRRQHIETINLRYDALAVAPDLTQPFVYVALHLQPERSTNPLGGVFDEQYLMAGMIASVLPPGWRVYVKEHPSQFAPQFASDRGRWTSIYEALIALPQVTLVSRQTVSFDLIDNARAVATITGTSSWEAIVRGIPTLVFGEAWYKGCPGSYAVRTMDDCRQALAQIAAGERPNPAATRLFLRAAEEASFVGFLSSDDAEIAGIDEVTNVQRLTRAIAECYAASTA